MKASNCIDTLRVVTNGESLIVSLKSGDKHGTRFKSHRTYCPKLFNMLKRKYVLNIDKGDVIRSRSLQGLFVLGDRMSSYFLSCLFTNARTDRIFQGARPFAQSQLLPAKRKSSQTETTGYSMTQLLWLSEKLG